MDSIGRIPVLAGGYVIGLAGALVTAVGTHVGSTTLAVLGFAMIGVALGTTKLSRTAAADMYPPEKRARGISFVLFGAVFGAILGPAVFTPLFKGHNHGSTALVEGWIAAAAFMAVGLLLVLFVRPDTRKIAERIAAARRGAGEEVEEEAPAAPLAEIIRRPGVMPAFVAGLATFGVMSSVMNLTGIMVVNHGHPRSDVFPIISLHIVGMFGLVLVVGDLVDRIGRTRSLVGGLFLVGASVLGLAWIASVPGMAVCLFLLGLGWSFSFVAATAELSDLSAASERGKLLGLNDLGSGLLGACLALIGGFVLAATPKGFSVAETALAVGPAFWILADARRRSSLADPALGVALSTQPEGE
jgi:MFS family permease